MGASAPINENGHDARVPQANKMKMGNPFSY
jgi:hypothetical protein